MCNYASADVSRDAILSCGLVTVSTGSAIYNLMPGLVLTVTRTKLKCQTNGSSYGCLISKQPEFGCYLGTESTQI
jgi:hypothetical protein